MSDREMRGEEKGKVMEKREKERSRGEVEGRV